MNPKVSILVPVYKASAFIEKCATSLFNQTFADIEYVFVNDATPDDSIGKLQEIIERYPNRKNNTRIINHQTNRGSAASKSSAIEAANGDYISFVDSDDYIDAEMIEAMYNKALKENADVVVCNMIIEFENNSVVFNDLIFDKPEDNFLNMILHDKTSSSMCNKLIKSPLYKQPDCKIPENLNYCEDWHIMTRIYYFSNKIVKTDRAFYHYIQYNSGSITKTINRMHFENIMLFWKLFDDFIKEQNIVGKYQQLIELPKLQSKVRLLLGTNSIQLRKEFANIFKTEELHCAKQLRRGEKLMLFLVRHKQFRLSQVLRFYLLAKNRNTRTTKKKLALVTHLALY
ncbi:MAG TPA: glycosyltransferase family 2 protein [Paludibacter sp.]|nr:glycosyltransferase family 2 protein [Paludibacter sp.]